jgi:serine/threonine-protein kinase
MALKTRVWSAGKLVVVAGGLLATYLLFAAASMRIALRAREVEVPDLSGRTTSEATAVAADLGLTLRVDDVKRPDPKIQVGRIVAQEPAAGSTARRQRSLRVWLSAGERPMIMPPLVGETERAAQLRLAQDGLAPATVTEIRSHDLPSDVVVAQDPPPKTSAVRISVLVNRGERGDSYVMPDLIGLNGDRAAELLRDRGFRVAVVGSTPYPGVAAGIVIRQNPQSGFQIGPGEPISLEVSR